IRSEDFAERGRITNHFVEVRDTVIRRTSARSSGEGIADVRAPMSHEGVGLVMRAALVIVMIVVAAFFRALVGPGRKRGQIMLLGTLGGVSFGVLVAYLVSHWLQ